MPRPARLVLLAALAVGLAACGSEPAPPPEAAPGGAVERPAAGPRTVLDAVAEAPELSTLAGLVEAADLGGVLRDTSQTITLFAPSDGAFAGMPPDALVALRNDPAALRAVLLAHVLPTRLPSADVFAEIAFESAGGPELTVDAPDGAVVVRGPAGAGRVTTADLDAANGVVHVVDTVLALPDAL